MCGSVEWVCQTMSAQETFFALSSTIGCLFLELRLLLLRLITRTASIVFSNIAHNLSKKTVYGSVDSNFKKHDVIGLLLHPIAHHSSCPNYVQLRGLLYLCDWIGGRHHQLGVFRTFRNDPRRFCPSNCDAYFGALTA